MRNVDQRLRRAQEAQSTRQEDLKSGRIRVERPEPRESSTEKNKDKQNNR